MFNFLEQNSLFVVLLVVLIIWIGLYYEIFKLEKRLKKIEKKNED
jgi:hypothetical protein